MVLSAMPLIVVSSCESVSNSPLNTFSSVPLPRRHHRHTTLEAEQHAYIYCQTGSRILTTKQRLTKGQECILQYLLTTELTDSVPETTSVRKYPPPKKRGGTQRRKSTRQTSSITAMNNAQRNVLRSSWPGPGGGCFALRVCTVRVDTNSSSCTPPQHTHTHTC